MRISIKYACQHCTNVATGYYEGFLSASTILICDRCDKQTYVHLDRPGDFEAKERVREAITKLDQNKPRKSSGI